MRKLLVPVSVTWDMRIFKSHWKQKRVWFYNKFVINWFPSFAHNSFAHLCSSWWCFLGCCSPSRRLSLARAFNIVDIFAEHFVPHSEPNELSICHVRVAKVHVNQYDDGAVRYRWVPNYPHTFYKDGPHDETNPELCHVQNYLDAIWLGFVT